MALDPNIALGVRGIELPNQLAQYGQIAQIQQAQQANQLNALKMQEAQANMEERNALRQLNPTSADYESQLFKLNPQLGIAFRKEASAAAASKAQQQSHEVTTAQKKQEMIGQAYRDISSRPDNENIISHTRDILSSPFYDANEKAAVQARADQMLKIPIDQRQSFLAQQGAKAGDLKPTVQSVNQYGQTQLLRVPAFDGAPTSVGTYADVPLPAAVETQKARIAKAGASNIRVDQKQESAFESGLGTGQAKRIIDSQVAAKDAASIIDTVKTGRDLMKSGMITGAGADFLVNLNQGLKTVGIDAGLADAAANSQAFTANMAGNVGKLIKQFGAGTGLSDADREFAKDMAGGRISLDAKAINRILDINERAARNVITQHNKDVKGVKTNIPLEVEMPPEVKAPVAGAPSSAIDYLRANPSMKGAFDAKYGAGAADRALKGQ